MRCACVSCLCRHLRITRGPADPPRFCLLFFSLISQRRLRAHFPLISHLLFQPRAARPEERAHTPGLAGCLLHSPPPDQFIQGRLKIKSARFCLVTSAHTRVWNIYAQRRVVGKEQRLKLAGRACAGRAHYSAGGTPKSSSLL